MGFLLGVEGRPIWSGGELVQGCPARRGLRCRTGSHQGVPWSGALVAAATQPALSLA